jgi:hypothetical protein
MHHHPNGADLTMPTAARAPRNTARRIARKRLRESGEQLAATNGGARADETYSRYVKRDELKYSMDELEQFCVGCGRMLSPLECYRVTRRDGRQYCLDCAERPLPTAPEMLAVVGLAFDIIAAVARRGDEGSLDERVAKHAQDELELSGFDWDHWEALVRVWQHLAYRPLVAV